MTDRLPWTTVGLLVAVLLSSLPSAAPARAAAPTDVPAFVAVWDRVDRPVVNQTANGRGYTWGPRVAAAAGITTELYDGQPRRVAYFDKARMELAQPTAAPSDPAAVSTGLLVRELVSGLRQEGAATFLPLTPSLTPVIGDPNDGGANPIAPTYASFQRLAGDAGAQPSRPGQPIADYVDRAGQVRAGRPAEARWIGGYDAATRHNIADVFIAYGEQTGPLWDGTGPTVGSIFFDNPTAIFGRPITEPYWTRAIVGGQAREVLVQLFERRVLTYAPDTPAGARVEMGNVGQHYFHWRYQATTRPVQPAGLAALNDLYSLTRVGAYAHTHMASSAEPNSQNVDFGSYLYQEPGRYVIFDAYGPGAVSRIWMTGFPGTRRLEPVGNLQFFFDDEPTPRVDLPAEAFFSGDHAPFLAPLVAPPAISSGGSVSYVPMPFASRLKIATTGQPAYYQINYQRLAGDQPVHSFTGREDHAHLAAILASTGADPKPATPNQQLLSGSALTGPGSEVGLGPTLTGPAVISALRVRLEPRKRDQFQHLALRMEFDGRAPDVDIPFDFFFGSGLGERRIEGLLLGIDPDAHAYYSYFPMPFHREARFTVVNRSFQPLTLHWEIALEPDPSGRLVTADTGYFRVTYRREREPRYGDDYVVLSARGRGRYIGTIVSFYSDERAMEGDERVFIDGSQTPQLRGTGYEDYFNAAWGFEGAFSRPLYGAADLFKVRVPSASRAPGVVPNDAFKIYTTTSAYRFLVAEATIFSSSIEVGFEHGPSGRNKPAEDEVYASAAFWYGLDEPGLVRTDHFYIGDRPSEAAHSYRSLGPVDDTLVESRYEGSPNTPERRETSRQTSGSRFRMAIAPDNAGVVLRRQFDAAAINQQAHVSVDGRLIGRWYHPGRNGDRRWRDDDFLLPASVTAGKTTIEITIEAIVDPSLWHETAYAAYCLRPGLAHFADGAPLPGP